MEIRLVPLTLAILFIIKLGMIYVYLSSLYGSQTPTALIVYNYQTSQLPIKIMPLYIRKTVQQFDEPFLKNIVIKKTIL